MTNVIQIKKWTDMAPEKMAEFVGGALDVVTLEDSTALIINHGQDSALPVNPEATTLLNASPLPFNPTEILGNSIHCLQIHD